jgi:hypothetical protein
MKKVFSFLLLVVSGIAQAAGFYELDHDWNRPGKQVATVTVGGLVGPFVPMLVVDSTGYYEGFVRVRRPMKLGVVSITPYFGLEGLKGANPRARGLFTVSAQLGPLSASALNEFGGVTGNFHKERVWADVGSYSLGLVRHSSAGFGPRIDYRLVGGTTVYLQYLQKGDASRLTFAVSGAF